MIKLPGSNQLGISQILPLLLIVAVVGALTFLFYSSVVPNGSSTIVNDKPSSFAQTVSGVKLTINPGSVVSQVNQIFNVAINMDTGTDRVSAVELHLTFDPTKLQIQSMTPNSPAPWVEVFSPGVVFDNAAGTAAVTLGSGSANPVTGTAVNTVNITFKAISVGSSTIGFANTTQTASIGKTSNSTISQLGSTVTVTAPTPVPTPIPTPTPTPIPAGGTVFNGPHNVPGTLQAEDFDSGGEIVAYHDLDVANQGGGYRTTERVDIQTTTDTGGGFNVGWMQAGEWLKYTVNTTTTGTYNLAFRVASQGVGGTFHLEVDGVDKTGSLTIPNTNSWQTFTTVTKPNVALIAGAHTFRVVMDTNGSTGYVGNLNYITTTLAAAATPVPTPTPVPVPNGLTGSYFNNQTLSGSPTLSRIDAAVNFDWANGSPAAGIPVDHFSIRWTGMLKPSVSGGYQLCTNTDDGSRLWVNNTLLVDKWGDRSASRFCGTMNLTAGQSYPINLEYYENGGRAVAQLQWALPGSASFVAIPSANFLSR